MSEAMRLMVVTTGLQLAGAESALFRLLVHLDRRRFAPSVVSLTDEGHYGARLRSEGIAVAALGMRPGRPSLRAFAELRALMRRERPALVQAWMYHADLMGGLAARSCGIPVAWSLRQSDLSAKHSPLSTRAVRAACALLSRFVPAAIACCSERARDVHVAAGYSDRRITVIPNGYDTASLMPRPEWRERLRSELGLDAGTLLIGHVARFHPQKDHATFIAAAGLALRDFPTAHVVMCGEGVSNANAALAAGLDATGQRARFHLLGPRPDATALMSAFDVFVVSSSFGEGFPNVLAESMCNEVPCVTTDVGDAALIVGDTGRIVPIGDAPALAAAIAGLLAMPRAAREQLGRRGRARIASEFTLGAMAGRFGALYEAMPKARWTS